MVHCAPSGGIRGGEACLFSSCFFTGDAGGSDAQDGLSWRFQADSMEEGHHRDEPCFTSAKFMLSTGRKFVQGKPFQASSRGRSTREKVAGTWVKPKGVASSFGSVAPKGYQ